MTVANAYTRPVVDRIFWATDFSEPAGRALAYAIGLARHYEATLVLAHVSPGTFPLLPAEAAPEYPFYNRTEAEEQLQALAESERMEGLRVERLVCEGDLPETLLRQMVEQRADLLVVGTHGRSGWRRVILGSVAEQLFRRSSCPVLTVGPGAEPPLPPETEFRQILFPTDFRLEAQPALNWALSLAQEHQATLTLLYVVESGFQSLEDSGRMEEAIRRQLADLVPEEVKAWCEPQLEVRFGNAGEMIVKAAGERDADLILLGVRPPRVASERARWTTAHHVVREAHCPVLTVRG